MEPTIVLQLFIIISAMVIMSYRLLLVTHGSPHAMGKIPWLQIQGPKKRERYPFVIIKHNVTLENMFMRELAGSSCFFSSHINIWINRHMLIYIIVDRRYRRYCEQMKAVLSTFEEVAGEGAARTYSMLASKAMSRHFRCLRDGITGQIKATRRAMGENDSSITPGLTRGETPRLKLLDQTLRQHKSFQQAGMMENHPWRPQRGLPERSVSILRAWLFEHFLHPYPSDVDKHILARQTGLSRSQVSNWFINARVRLWKPMVEEMYMEEIKEEEESSMQPSHETTMHEGGNISSSHAISNPNPSPSSQPHFDHQDDHKPGHIPGHLQINDEQHSLSSIISSMHAHHSSPNPNPNHSFGGILDADFGSYRSGHELTLGLQQHDRPLLFSREPVDVVGDDGDALQFSMLVGDQGQNIPYRNLMGAQLLHDLAG